MYQAKFIYFQNSNEEQKFALIKMEEIPLIYQYINNKEYSALLKDVFQVKAPVNNLDIIFEDIQFQSFEIANSVLNNSSQEKNTVNLSDVSASAASETAESQIDKILANKIPNFQSVIRLITLILEIEYQGGITKFYRANINDNLKEFYSGLYKENVRKLLEKFALPEEDQKLFEEGREIIGHNLSFSNTQYADRLYLKK